MLFGGAVQGAGAGALLRLMTVLGACSLGCCFGCCLGCWLRCSSGSAARGAGVQSLASVSLSGVYAGVVLFFFSGVWLKFRDYRSLENENPPAFSPTAESYGVSAQNQIGSGVVKMAESCVKPW